MFDRSIKSIQNIYSNYRIYSNITRFLIFLKKNCHNSKLRKKDKSNNCSEKTFSDDIRILWGMMYCHEFRHHLQLAASMRYCMQNIFVAHTGQILGIQIKLKYANKIKMSWSTMDLQNGFIILLKNWCITHVPNF